MVDKIITKFENYSTIFCFTAMSIITLLGVFCRYVLSNPITWGEELSRYFMIWGILIGISIVTRKKSHLGIDVISAFAPPKLNKSMAVIASILLILSYALLFCIAVKFVIQSYALGQVTPILRIKFYLIYLALPVGFALSTYRAIQVFWIDFIKVAETEENEKPLQESEVYL
ncbi:TRAP transporter small permease [Ureibacillus aquaedulcis]|uniref:TRAP transporter small permease n=1 Tax=Ureibacillus aquaedulcis TaxID=3058421 RepID=A0ABT8GVZ5_9BACL|nr:TRAP transporter small permease [Ureibacillus sp. BA0131]MDN4495588.1 TRAP transporter small permease [Ureibacillus sp. BA0131]